MKTRKSYHVHNIIKLYSQSNSIWSRNNKIRNLPRSIDVLTTITVGQILNLAERNILIKSQHNMHDTLTVICDKGDKRSTESGSASVVSSYDAIKTSVDGVVSPSGRVVLSAQRVEELRLDELFSISDLPLDALVAHLDDDLLVLFVDDVVGHLQPDVIDLLNT